MTDRELMQQALSALEVSTDWDMGATGKQAQSIRAITALRARLAQPEQEIESDQDHVEDDGCPTEKAVLQRFWREHQKQELEGINDVILNSIRDSSEVVAPPQREWVGLTDMEIVGIASLNQSNDFSFARAIEAKLKAKNAL